MRGPTGCMVILDPTEMPFHHTIGRSAYTFV
jgi:hypothetical protein